jgi:hypothetical protein
MEKVEELIGYEGGRCILGVVTENYRFDFPPEARPTKDHHLQVGDAVQIDYQGQGGRPIKPRVNFYKPGIAKPIYSPLLPANCIKPMVH